MTMRIEVDSPDKKTKQQPLNIQYQSKDHPLNTWGYLHPIKLQINHRLSCVKEFWKLICGFVMIRMTVTTCSFAISLYIMLSRAEQ